MTRPCTGQRKPGSEPTASAFLTGVFSAAGGGTGVAFQALCGDSSLAISRRSGGAGGGAGARSQARDY